MLLKYFFFFIACSAKKMDLLQTVDVGKGRVEIG